MSRRRRSVPTYVSRRWPRLLATHQSPEGVALYRYWTALTTRLGLADADLLPYEMVLRESGKLVLELYRNAADIEAAMVSGDAKTRRLLEGRARKARAQLMRLEQHLADLIPPKPMESLADELARRQRESAP